MANDLVRWGRLDGDGYPQYHETDTVDDNEQWDTPPDQPRPLRTEFSPKLRLREGNAAVIADKDAADFRRRGDSSGAFTREGDAAEHRQSPWDWGDLRTWLIIVGMCVGFLLFSACVYYMPQGRHGQVDGPEPVPQIRNY